MCHVGKIYAFVCISFLICFYRFVHVFISGSGPADNGKFPKLQGAHDGLPSVATISQGGFAYLPINPDASYYIFAADRTGTEGNITASTIVEFGVFN